MKKIMGLVLAVIMSVSMGVSVFAAENVDESRIIVAECQESTMTDKENQEMEQEHKVSLQVMPSKRTKYTGFEVTSSYPPASVYVKVKIECTIDANNNNIISIDNVEAGEGESINLDDLPPLKVTAKKVANKNGYVNVTVKGKAKFIYTNPQTGVVLKNTVDIDKTLSNVYCGY